MEILEEFKSFQRTSPDPPVVGGGGCWWGIPFGGTRTHSAQPYMYICIYIYIHVYET